MVQGSVEEIQRDLSASLQRLLPRSDNIIWNGTFHNKFEDKSYAIAIFNQHIAQVKQTVSPDRLLVYEVKQGWEPLCRFLKVPVPQDKSFPHLNDTAEFRGRWMMDTSNEQG